MKIAQLTIPAGDVRPGDTLILPDNSHLPVRALDNSNPVIVTLNSGPAAIIRARRTEVTVLRELNAPPRLVPSFDEDDEPRYATASLGGVGIRLVAADPAYRLLIGTFVPRCCAVAFLAGALVGGLLAWRLP